MEDLLSAAACANTATNEFNKCNIKYIDSLLAAQNTKEDKMKVAQLCWSVFYYQILIKILFLMPRNNIS